MGWVFYDGGCPLCRWVAARAAVVLARFGFCFAPLQDPWVAELLELDPTESPDEMKVLTSQGRIVGGPDAVLHLADAVWWARPLALLARLPVARGLVRGTIRWLSAHRHCLTGGCSHRPGNSRRRPL